MDWIDLPTTWAALLGIAVFMYILLDGMDLGVAYCSRSPIQTKTGTS